jgi:hypothetical protein
VGLLLVGIEELGVVYRRLRDVFYINGNISKGEFNYYGMEFSEFIQYSPKTINNLLLLAHNYHRAEYCSRYYLDIVEGQRAIELMAKDDIYTYGDFCFVDYDQHSDIENLSPTEVASLLYLSHMKSPLDSAFFNVLKNNYAYLAHDDGWFCRLHCKDATDFSDIIGNKITDAVKDEGNFIPNPLSSELKSQLLQMTENGLLIDLYDVYESFDDGPEACIYIYQIGMFLDMDDMYNNLVKWKATASYKGWLTYKNQQWSLET